jgi:signal transduction histidine kinase
LPIEFNNLLTHLIELRTEEPAHNFENIFQMWLQATGASWVLFWTRNEGSHNWGVRFAASKDGERHWPSVQNTLGPSSVAQYCVDSGETAFVDTPSWIKVYNSNSYRVNTTLPMQQGLHSFQCIPLTGALEPTAMLARFGVICLHYENAVEMPFSNHELKLLGRLTWMKIQQSFLFKQERILNELNELAARFGKQDKKRPAFSRQRYVENVISLTQSELGVRAASVFYRDTDEKGVRCIGTTDKMVDMRSGNLIRNSSVFYRNGVGGTGHAVSSGRLEIISREENESRKPLYVESIEGITMFPTSTVFCPIFSSTEKDKKNLAKVIGLIRCVDPSNREPLNNRARFDMGEMETLQFIASQIAPDLELFESRISREQTISIIKHDLVGPIALVRHIADDLESSRQGPRGSRIIPFRKLMNIKAFALEASHLILQLDPDQKTMYQYLPRLTSLGGEIIARLSIIVRHIAKEENSMGVRFGDFSHWPKLWVDKNLVERVLFNLFTNAIKYGEAGTTIMVRSRIHSDEFVIDVSNEGVGVQDGDEDKIFEENFRSSDAPTMKVGLGLGLFISKKAMERHGGQLVLKQRANPTIFRMIFPAELENRKAE